MISFSFIDLAVIGLFFLLLFLFGFLPKSSKDENTEEFLLSGRNLGLFLFVMTNVATWYGGILGVGEFTYRYGLLSWFTQGFPYYIFALLFGLFFASKVRESSLFTIPDKLESVYGKNVGILSALVVFILVSPAPYILMLTQLIKLIFGTSTFISAIIALFISVVYLFKGGYKSDVYTDAFQFFVMFIGFIILIFVLISNYGSYSFLAENLPEQHLNITGGASPFYILVWFLIALWTFTDPGFHQRSYAAKTPSIAKKGILISIIFWFIFDFLTASTGLYSKAILPNLENPIFAFPLLAEKVLAPGLKGVFYAALFATIISTLNSYLFLSATTFGRDFIFKLTGDKNKINFYTRTGLFVASVLGLILALSVDSIIDLWYLIGSICIPGMIFLIIGAYYQQFRISNTLAFIELLLGVISSFLWYLIRNNLAAENPLNIIEPMIVGLFTVGVIHLIGIFPIRKTSAK